MAAQKSVRKEENQ
jgi:hypothetical protein